MNAIELALLAVEDLNKDLPGAADATSLKQWASSRERLFVLFEFAALLLLIHPQGVSDAVRVFGEAGRAALVLPESKEVH